MAVAPARDAAPRNASQRAVPRPRLQVAAPLDLHLAAGERHVHPREKAAATSSSTAASGRSPVRATPWAKTPMPSLERSRAITWSRAIESGPPLTATGTASTREPQAGARGTRPGARA